MQRAMFILLAILLLPTIALAHAIGVTCTIRGDKVEVEAFYDDDTPAHKAKVQLVNFKDEVVATGITDKDGIYTFSLPKPGKYEVRIDAGAGHRAKKALVVPGTIAEEPGETQPTPTIEPTEPTREEQTRTPWGRIGLGLAIIFAISVAVMALMQSRGSNSKPLDSKQSRL